MVLETVQDTKEAGYSYARRLRESAAFDGGNEGLRAAALTHCTWFQLWFSMFCFDHRLGCLIWADDL